jgi:cell division protein FtsQ
MTGIASVSSTQLKNRRQKLQGRRRLKALQAIWRFCAIASMAGGSVWVITLPQWTISQQSQIEIIGNRLVSQDQIRKLIPLEKPQSVWQLPTQQIIARLEANPPLADAQVTRQILPPKLTVEVTERQPVAVAVSGREVGFLDAQGIFIPKSFYEQAGQNWKVPTLKVTGYRDLYRQQWEQLYSLVARSQIKVSEVDWRNPSNLVLKTELGTVYCGSYTERFPEQLSVLARMRQLPTRVPGDRITYIDLTDPAFPTIQLKSQKSDRLDRPSVRNQ